MIDAAAMLDPTLVLPERQAATRDNAAAGFSFAGAMAALEARAAQSLETFGVTPQLTTVSDAVAAARDRRSRAAESPQQTDAPQMRAAPKSAPAKSAPPSADAPRPTAPSAQGPAPAQQPAIPAAAPAVATTAGVTLAARQPGAAAQRAEAPIAAKLDAARPQGPKAPRAATPTASSTPAQDFAKLVARRLEAGGSAFELRLDPPALGRVEAQLKLSDAGEATLSLKFENQTALDYFTRDEAALRLALADAGYDLGGQRLAFALAENSGRRIESADAAAAIDHYEPQFSAPYSRGVVDLRA